MVAYEGGIKRGRIWVPGDRECGYFFVSSSYSEP
jgi:hypothetical protein